MTKDSISDTSRGAPRSGDERPLGEEPAGVRPEQLAAAARVMAHVMSRPARTTASMSMRSPLGSAAVPLGSIEA
jgi:hypothetical protein